MGQLVCCSSISVLERLIAGFGCGGYKNMNAHGTMQERVWLEPRAPLSLIQNARA